MLDIKSRRFSISINYIRSAVGSELSRNMRISLRCIYQYQDTKERISLKGYKFSFCFQRKTILNILELN